MYITYYFEVGIEFKTLIKYLSFKVVSIYIKSYFLILGCVSALQLACADGNLEIVSYLISKGVDLDAKELPDSLLNPLVWAYRGNHKEIVKLLLNAGADPKILEDYIKKTKHCCCTLL